MHSQIISVEITSNNAVHLFPTEEKDLSVSRPGDHCSYHLQRAGGERKEPGENLRTHKIRGFAGRISEH